MKIKVMLRKLLWILRGRANGWKLCKTGWPYEVGYGTWRWQGYRKVLLDSGLTREQAEECLEELNSFKE